MSSLRPPAIKRIALFSTWMQAWNLYLAIILAHNPSQTVELFGYQWFICSVNTLLPCDSWLQYDNKFRTLAAVDLVDGSITNPYFGNTVTATCQIRLWLLHDSQVFY